MRATMDFSYCDDSNLNKDSLETKEIQNGRRMKIGVWWSDKPSSAWNNTDMSALFYKHGFELVELDLDGDLEAQGPFAAIVQKLIKVIASDDLADKRRVDNLKKYLKKHPEVAVVDPLDNLELIRDRSYLLTYLNFSSLFQFNERVCIPPFYGIASPNLEANLSNMAKYGVTFPVICKPLNLHDTPESHQMMIVFDTNGFNYVKYPCLVQSYFNHDARLIKIFVLKDKFMFAMRPSVRNFQPGEISYSFIPFNTNEVCQQSSNYPLNQLNNDDPAWFTKPKELDFDLLCKIAAAVSSTLGLELLGIDVIIHNTTGRYCIIDVNHFPTYSGLDIPPERIREWICELVLGHIVNKGNEARQLNELNQNIDNEVMKIANQIENTHL